MELSITLYFGYFNLIWPFIDGYTILQRVEGGNYKTNNCFIYHIDIHIADKFTKDEVVVTSSKGFVIKNSFL